MQFKVPQFLDIEDKIFGPFTFSEFVYLAGGGGLCFVIYKSLGLLLGIIPILLVGGFAIALVFYRPNDKPLIDMIESGLKYAIQSKLYIWQQDTNPKREAPNTKQIKSAADIELRTKNENKLSSSKIRDLAWSLDVLDIKQKEHGN